MKKTLFVLLLPITLIMAVNSAAFGLELGTNITISDNRFGTGDWYGDHEDQEVETGMVGDQIWDLEGFFFKDNILTLVGGYDFINGVDVSYDTHDNDRNFGPGDLFFDIDGVTSNSNTSEYDYVFDLDHDTKTYDIYKLDNGSQFKDSYFNLNATSDPWRYDAENSNQTKIKGGLSFKYWSGLDSYNAAGMTGDSHNAMIFDLSFFAALFDTKSIDFLVHYTMECGNDNILGEGNLPIPNPEPETFLLLGVALIGFGALLRKQQRKG